MCRGTGLVQNFQTPIYIYTHPHMYIYVYIYMGEIKTILSAAGGPIRGPHSLPAGSHLGAHGIGQILEQRSEGHWKRTESSTFWGWYMWYMYIYLSIYLSIYGYIWMICGILSKYIYFISIYGKSPFWFLAVLKRSEVKKLIFVDFRGFIG